MKKSQLLRDYKQYLTLCASMGVSPNPDSPATLYKSLVERYGYDAVMRHSCRIERILLNAKSRVTALESPD